MNKYKILEKLRQAEAAVDLLPENAEILSIDINEDFGLEEPEVRINVYDACNPLQQLLDAGVIESWTTTDDRQYLRETAIVAGTKVFCLRGKSGRGAEDNEEGGYA